MDETKSEDKEGSSAFKDLLEYLDITNIEIKQGQSNDLPPEEFKGEHPNDLEKLLLEESKEDDAAAFVAHSLDQVDRVLDEQLKKSSESQGSNGGDSDAYYSDGNSGSSGNGDPKNQTDESLTSLQLLAAGASDLVAAKRVTLHKRKKRRLQIFEHIAASDEEEEEKKA